MLRALRHLYIVLQPIVVVTLMMQSYLVTEDDNKRLNSDQEVFKWLVTVLDCAIRDVGWHGHSFAIIEVIKVRLTKTVGLRHSIIVKFVLASLSLVLSNMLRCLMIIIFR